VGQLARLRNLTSLDFRIASPALTAAFWDTFLKELCNLSNLKRLRLDLAP